MSIVDNMFGLLSAYIAEDGGDSAEKLSVAVEAYRNICESSERLAAIGYGVGHDGANPMPAQRHQTGEAEVVAEDEADDLGVDFAETPVREGRKLPSTLPFGGRLVRDGVVVPNAEADPDSFDRSAGTTTVEVEVPAVNATRIDDEAAFVPDGEDVLEAMRDGDDGDFESEFGSDTWSGEPIVGDDVPEDGDVTIPDDEYEISDRVLSGADDDDSLGDLSAFDDLEGLDAEVGDDFEDPLMQDLREAEAAEGADVADDGGKGGDLPGVVDGDVGGGDVAVEDDDDEFGIGVALPSIPSYDLDGFDVADPLF